MNNIKSLVDRSIDLDLDLARQVLEEMEELQIPSSSNILSVHVHPEHPLMAVAFYKKDKPEEAPRFYHYEARPEVLAIARNLELWESLIQEKGFSIGRWRIAQLNGAYSHPFTR